MRGRADLGSRPLLRDASPWRVMNGPADGEVDYKKKYRNLKRKLKFLIYEHECFQEELRKAQRKLLKVSRDKSFLLDRLLQYENVDEDSSGIYSYVHGCSACLHSRYAQSCGGPGRALDLLERLKVVASNEVSIRN